jgi:acyl-[acyl-carrier-protein]-phospholipid O-acyltransferase / long-chain-fatty-acid--[acyl-carrier-protein] ligase
MSAPDLSLLAKRRFAPMFVVQFLGAFNDNLLKFAMLFLASFGIYAADPDRAEQLGVIATGLFTLPYFLFSALAGQVADRIDKARLVRIVKGAEVAIMGIGLAGFALEEIPLLLSAVFLLGCHSTMFGPVKFSILPQHLRREEIVAGTGLFEAGTFLAILSGQLTAGVLSPLTAGAVALALAVAGLAAALLVRPAPPARGGHPIDWNLAKATWDVLKVARSERAVWLAVIGISWFFSAGAVLLSEFAAIVSGPLGAEQDVASLFLAVFSVTIALGSVLVNRLLKGEISARYVPLCALALAIGLIDLGFSTAGFAIETPGAGIAEFFVMTPQVLRITFDLVLIGLAGGMFIVPLYAILQTGTDIAERSQAIAANNIMNAAMTVAAVAAVAGLLGAGASASEVVSILGGGTLVIAALLAWKLPRAVPAASC